MKRTDAEPAAARPRRKRLLIGAAVGIVLLAVTLAVLLPRLVDAESYRGLLRTQLESRLGREVRFGTMQLSLWPVLGLRLDELTIGKSAGERIDDPIVADSLRVGARLMPLLRGRLEVTSLVVERPLLKLFHHPDGHWEPSFTTADTATEEPPTQAAVDAAPLVIEQLRVTGGRVRLHDEEKNVVTEVALDEIDISLDGFGGAAPLAFSLSAAFEGSGRLRLNGELLPSPAQISTAIEVEDLAPVTLSNWLEILEPGLALPDGLLADGRLSATARLSYITGPPAILTVSQATVRGCGVQLVRSVSGVWNHAPLLDSPPEEVAEDDPTPMSIRLTDLSIEDSSLSIEDRSGGGASTTLRFAPLSIGLRQPSQDAPIEIELDSTVGGNSSGKLTVRGTLGTSIGDLAEIPLDLSMSLSGLALRGLLPPVANLDLSNASLESDLRLAGTIARELSVEGDLAFSNVSVTVASPGGGTRSTRLDLGAKGSIRLRDALSRVELSKLDLELPRARARDPISLHGSIDLAASPAHVDLRLVPTRIVADDVAALAALLAPDAPLRFASPDPVELELAAKGPIGDGRLPALVGRAKLSKFTFLLPGMSQPMEDVGAEVRFSSERVILEGLGGRIGKSDVRNSRVELTHFDAPRVLVDLQAGTADFWELFSFIEADEPSSTATPGDDAFADVEVRGTLNIDRGSLQTLRFERMTSTMLFSSGVLKLAPLEMDLFGGHFSGSLVQDLGRELLTIEGKGVDVDADGFLSENLGLGGVVSGLMSTDLNMRALTSDPDNLIVGIAGGGPLQLNDGRLARLQVLKSLSKVTGIFGESSLQRLTRQLATEGTPFRRAEARLNFNAGTLAFEDLVLETAELTLAGRTVLDAVSGKLEGRLAVAFSPELSAAMRAERSRAADLFWDPKTQRVSFGFGVSGTATAPSVKVDWEGALRDAAERKLGDRLRGLLEKKSGTSAQSVSPEVAAGDSPVEAPSPGLAVEVVRTRWSGPVLLRDLVVEGTVRGAELDRASITLVDARGTELKRTDRLASVEERLTALADRAAEVTIPFQFKVDGKRFVTAKFPLSLKLTVHDLAGRSASVTRGIDR